jgi:hypothetical protein
MLPSVEITKLDGNTGVVSPSAKGILAIIAPCEKGTANLPVAVTKTTTALSTFGYGALTEAAGYVISTASKQVLLIRATASTAATYSAVTFVGTGTSVGTAGASAPLDDFGVLITIVNGGTRGVDGVTYTYSLDGGLLTSAVQSLGLATSIVIPNSGVTLNLAAGTFVAGDTYAFTTVGPKLTTGDLSTALEALRTSSQPYEGILVAGHDGVAGSITILDAWLAAREAEGKYRFFIINSRMKNSGETEAAYLTAMGTAFNASASIRGCVCADGGDLISSLPGRGLTTKRRTSLALAARLMKIDLGRDAAYVQDGPVPGFGLADANGNPKNHDEAIYPGLDDIRLTTLRTFDRRNGTYITNPKTIAANGSDYVYAQHIRTINRACEIVFDTLTGELSAGVDRNPRPGPNGEVYIAEEDARRFEALANSALSELLGDVAGVRFVLSRTDNIGTNGLITVTGDIQVSSISYIKKFKVNSSFVKSITINPT